MYQPIISENWKFRKGLRITIGTEKVNALPIKNDIEYQYSIINDEFKLLEDNYSYYKTRIITNDLYYDSFKSISLSSKIKYNKSLEETIGILYILHHYYNFLMHFHLMIQHNLNYILIFLNNL